MEYLLNKGEKMKFLMVKKIGLFGDKRGSCGGFGGEMEMILQPIQSTSWAIPSCIVVTIVIHAPM